MRSRYTAYATNQIDYLERSHAPGEAHTFNRSAAEAWSEEADWLGLKIIATQGGDTKDREGVVEFIARYIWDSKEEEHHERALFLKIDGQWYFVGGKLVETDNDDGASPKIGRSMPCPCGSGKKYKKCCAA
jgi:SEC-C motif-containing protein